MTDDGLYDTLKRAYFEKLDAQTRRVHVVFAQGKTGTSTIAAALKRARLEPVLQIHTLHRRVLEQVEAEYLRRERNPHPRHVWEAQWLNEHRPSAALPWSLVTSARDPIARLVSRHFQRESRFGDLGEDAAAERILAELDDQCRRQARRLEASVDWFDDELLPVMGVSVYDTPFDPAVGYAAIETEHVRAVVVRSESLDQAPAGLRWLFGDRRLELRSENVAADKGYSGLYRTVLDRFRPPPDYVTRVYDTRFARHFYSGDERDAFRQFWTRPPGARG